MLGGVCHVSSSGPSPYVILYFTIDSLTNDTLDIERRAWLLDPSRMNRIF